VLDCIFCILLLITSYAVVLDCIFYILLLIKSCTVVLDCIFYILLLITSYAVVLDYILCIIINYVIHSCVRLYILCIIINYVIHSCVRLYIYLYIHALLYTELAAARLLRSWVRITPAAWMSVCCECCVLSGRGLCDELIIRPEESYQLWCVVVF